MSESLIVKRLRRSLRYRRSYLKIYEAYAEADSSPHFAELLSGLVESQLAAGFALEQCLRRLDGGSEGLAPYDRLIAEAAKRSDAKSRLLFIHTGLSRAVDWYKTQLTDRRMTADPEHRQLLIDLGEGEAAQLWRTEAAMHLMRIPVARASTVEEEEAPYEITRGQDWRSELPEDVRRPSWGGEQLGRPPRVPRRRSRR